MSVIENKELGSVSLLENTSTFYKKSNFKSTYVGTVGTNRKIGFSKYILYYDDNSFLNNDRDYLLSCNVILNNTLEEFYKMYTIAVSDAEREDVKAKYINPLIKTTNFEVYKDLYKNEMISPGTGLLDLKNLIDSKKVEGQENEYENLISCLLKKTLYYCLHDLGNNENYFDFNEIIFKTFSKFEYYKPSVHTTPKSIENDLDGFVNELSAVINNIIELIKLTKETKADFFISKEVFGNKTEYTISTYSANSNSNFELEKEYFEDLNSLFEQSLDEYVDKYLGVERNNGYPTSLQPSEILENIEKVYVKGYDNRPKESSFKNNEKYEALASKWLYYMVFYPDKDNNPKKRRPSEIILINMNPNLGLDYSQIEELKNILLLEASLENLKTADNFINTILGNNSKVFTKFKSLIRSIFEQKVKEKEKELEENSKYGLIHLKELIEMSTSDIKKREVEVDKIIKKIPSNEAEYNLFNDIQKSWDEFVKDYDSALKNGKSDMGYTVEELEKNCIESISNSTLGNIEKIKADGIKDSLDKFKYIISLFAFFSYYDYSNNKLILVSDSISSIGENRYEKDRYQYKELSYKNLGSKDYDSHNELFEDLVLIVKEYFRHKKDSKAKQNEALASTEKTFRDFYNYNEYEKSILLNRAVYEEDFFFIKDLNGKKVIPISKYIDIDFITYDVDNILKGPEFISVVKRIDIIDEESKKLYSDNYFSSFELKDLGSEKRITLTLKSKDESNLEDIIYNSILGPVSYHEQNSSGSQVAEMFELIKSRKTNFRVRFGYSEITDGSDVIDESDILSYYYSKRTKEIKPVLKSPWLYFQIIDVKTKTLDTEFIYEIEGITMGSSIVNEYTFYSINQNSPNRFSMGKITPLESLKEIGKILYTASNGKLCLVSTENDNQIITSNDSQGYLDILDVKPPIERSEVFYKWTKGNISSNIPVFSEREKRRDISLISDEELKNKKLSIKDILDKYMEWLPTKQYAILTKDGGNPMAVELDSYENINLSSDISVISLKPSYEIIDCESKLSDEAEKSERSFIRIFYKGPINEKTADKVRVYSYKYKQDSVLKNVSIDNEINLGNIKNYCGIVGTGYNALYTAKYSLEKESFSATSNIVEVALDKGDLSSINNLKGDIILVPKNSVVSESNFKSDAQSGSESEKEETIKKDIRNLAYTSLQSFEHWPFEGDIEILGDPYYLTDNSLQLGRNMIFLDMNRINKINNGKEFLKRSYYTGLYYIKEISHSLSSGGDFLTKLKVVKYVIK